MRLTTEEIVKFHNIGFTQEQIAQIAGCDRSAISRRLKKYFTKNKN